MARGSVVQTESFPAHGAAEGVEGSFVERREAYRHRTVYRVVKLTVRGTTSLSQLCNISDEGMMITLDEEIEAGERIEIELSPDHLLSGRAVWVEDGHCGIALDEPIDSEALLHELAEEQRSHRHRAPRLEARLLGVAYSERGMHPVRTINLSQRGIGLTHDGRLEPGLSLLVMLENGIERRGVVRWAQEHSAGIQLIEPLGCADVNRCISANAGACADLAGAAGKSGSPAS